MGYWSSCGSISGQLKDSQGNPIFNAAVILDYSTSINADVNGSFSMTVTPGSHTIVIMKDGYPNMTKEFIVLPGENEDFGSLSFSALPDNRLDSFVLTAVIVASVLLVLTALTLWRRRT